jgi:hypothetical protein
LHDSFNICSGVAMLALKHHYSMCFQLGIAQSLFLVAKASEAKLYLHLLVSPFSVHCQWQSSTPRMPLSVIVSVFFTKPL